MEQFVDKIAMQDLVLKVTNMSNLLFTALFIIGALFTNASRASSLAAEHFI